MMKLSAHRQIEGGVISVFTGRTADYRGRGHGVGRRVGKMKRRTMVATAVLALAVGPGSAPGSAQTPVGQVTVTGRVQQVATYSIQDLAVLPAYETRATSYGNRESIFVGALLWPLIVAARPIPDPTWASNLNRVIFARGADGMSVAVAIAEADPRYEGKPLLVAYKQDGAMLPAPRLVVPGDRHAGRNVPNLVTLEVR